MNSLGEPTCLDDLACLATCPELRTALQAGDFQPARFSSAATWRYGSRIEIACYRMPHSRSAVRFFIQPCDTGSGRRWNTFGEWCEYGRTPCDACYDFLDGGGTFATRASSEWAIHLYVAHLLAEEACTAA